MRTYLESMPVSGSTLNKLASQALRPSTSDFLQYWMSLSKMLLLTPVKEILLVFEMVGLKAGIDALRLHFKIFLAGSNK